MVLRRLRPIIAVGVALSTLVPDTARARTVEYHAVEGCPSGEEVEARLDASAAVGRDARIEVRSVKGGFAGTITLGEGEEGTARGVEARTCGALIEAFALIDALDREALADDVRSASDDAAARPPPPRAWAVRAEEKTRATKARASVAADFGAVFTTTSFGAGEAMIGPGLFAEVGAPGGLFGLRWLRPSARASFLRTTSTEWAERGGVRPNLVNTGGSLEACLLSSTWSERLTFAACSHTDVGSLAVSVDGDEASSRARLWLATGAIGRMRFVFDTHGTVRPMIEFAGGALSTQRRDRLHFRGHDPIVAAAWSWTAAVGAGVELR